MKSTLSYQKAHEELVKIVAEIEQEQVQLDELSLKIKRAGELIAFCRTKLREAEDAFEKATRDIQS